ncbi:protein of unknown function [Pararobbsia alpina]
MASCKRPFRALRVRWLHSLRSVLKALLPTHPLPKLPLKHPLLNKLA